MRLRAEFGVGGELLEERQRSSAERGHHRRANVAGVALVLCEPDQRGERQFVRHFAGGEGELKANSIVVVIDSFGDGSGEFAVVREQ